MAQQDLRERNRERARRDIELAALRLFDEHGFGATSVADIAAAAGVSPRTFFRYFRTKDAVVSEGLQHLLDVLVDAMPEGEASRAAVRRALGRFADEIEADRESVLRRVRVTSHGESPLPVAAVMQRHWELAIGQRLAGRAEPMPFAAAMGGIVVVGAIRVALSRWVASNGRDDFGPLVQSAYAAVFSRST